MTKKYEFPISPIFPWIKGSIEVGPKITKITTRNTVLEVIPAGSNKQTIPMSNISTVSVRYGIKIGKVLLGIFFVATGVIAVAEATAVGVIAGIVFVLVGIAMFISGIPVYLDIETAGNTRTIYVPFYAKKTMDEIAVAMNNALARVESRKDVSQAADRIIGAIHSEKR